jgi:uncharacterized protein (DUF952 family)/GNAT superfamily N-acetyltransferase
MGVLLHLTTPATWREALAAGSVVPPSLLSDGFIHLSDPDQVHLPAGRLFAGRDDVLLLVIDAGRLTAPVRWEPGVATDPSSMRFPHLYGPLPVAAVTSVVPYRAGPDGSYGRPVGVPDPADLAARAMAFDRSLAQRRAAAVLPIAGGFAALDPRVAASHEHNSLWLAGAVDAAGVASDADRLLGGWARPRAVFDRPPPADLGWAVEEERVLVLGPGVPAPPAGPAAVVPVTSEVMAGLWRPSWHRDLPGITDGAVDDLVRREAFADAHCRIVDIAVLGSDGVPVAGTQLRIDGATAAIEAVMTDPGARGRGYGGSLVADAVRRAREAGCDLVWLIAAAEDWPRRWYERLGFVDVGARWVALGPESGTGRVRAG